MFLLIFGYELKYWLKNPVYYLYLAILFFPVMISMAGVSGVFGEDSVPRDQYSNSLSGLLSIADVFVKMLIFLIPAVTGHSVYRDFKSNIHQILFTYPITKTGYLSGKFLGSFIPVSFLALMIPAGLYIGTALPGIDSSILLPFNLSSYIKIYFWFLLPASLFFGVIIFAIVLFSCNIYAGFISIIVVMIMREAFLRLAGFSDAVMIADPLCTAALDLYSKSFNNNTEHYSGLILYNRILWITMSALIFSFIIKSFSFRTHAVSFNIFKKNNSLEKERFIEGANSYKIPEANFRSGFFNYLKTAFEISGVNFPQIIFSGSFIVILITGSIFILIILFQMNPPYGAKIQPRTFVMLGFPLFFFSMLVSLMTFLYSGLLIQRDRTSRMNELIDVNPVPDWVFLMSKLFALIKMQIFLLLILMVAGMLVQTTSGYFKFDIQLYLFSLFVIHLPGFIIWAFASLFVQTIIRNQYAGLIILTCLFFSIGKFPDLGIENLIFRFNQNPDPGFTFKYSEMSGYGHSLVPHLIYKSYWLLFSVILFILTLMFVQRGYVYTFKEKLKIAYSRFKGQYVYKIIPAILILITGGFFLYSGNNNYTFKAYSQEELDRIAGEADVKYSRLYKLPQPRIVSANIKADVFPETKSFNSEGSYGIVNKANKNIDTLIISYAENVLTGYSINRNSSVISKDDISKIDLLKIDPPLKPGDSLIMKFKVSNIPNTPLIKNSDIESNGTFITSAIYPFIGYFLNEKDLDRNDSSNLSNHYRAVSLDFLTLDLTVSTDIEQEAIAPGILLKKWSDDERNYYNYFQEKSTGDFAIVSGEYEKASEKAGNTTVEVFYFKEHTENVQRLLDGMKASVKYNQKYFGQSARDTIKLVEYSRALGNFAMSFTGLIPYSESNFLIDMSDTSDLSLDLPFLGAAHETAHQWWGNTVIPANVRGARLITESMAEYISLMVLEKKYGKEKAEVFLNKALDVYLKKRASGDMTENSLADNTGLNKSHVPYQKGSIALYAVKNYIGEENLNKALKKIFDAAIDRESSYVTSTDFINSISDAVPDSLKYIISDLFESVTFSNCKIIDAKTENTNGGYSTTINIEMNKHRVENEKEADVPVNDYVEIRLNKENSKGINEVIYEQMHKLTSKDNVVIINTAEKPVSVSVAELPVMIDQDITDNTFRIKSD